MRLLSASLKWGLLLVTLWSAAAHRDERPTDAYSASNNNNNNGYVSGERGDGFPRPGQVYYKPFPPSSSPSSSSSSGNPGRPVVGGRTGLDAIPLPDALELIRFRRLAQMIARANLVEMLSDRQRSFTIFAPTDEAIDKFLSSQPREVAESLNEGGEALSSLLLAHVVPGTMAASDLTPGSKVMSVGGPELEVRRASDGVVVGGAKLASGGAGTRVANGIVHPIVDVIFPYESQGEKKPVRPRLLGLDDDDPRLIVEVDGGRVRGINVDKEHRAWLGIPYAKPPLGSLRFAPPERMEGWHDDGILETRSQPNACQQTPDTAFGDFSGATQWNADTASTISEDCLYLSVHAPRNFTGSLPVLVWIYGGGYMTGSAALDVYRPDQLVKAGDGLVYVAMQYRLGSHGFLNMGRGSGAPGNVGLLDQVVALEWIQDNIEAFGGNPDDVTLMGESAGAGSVALHLASPKSCKLFNKAILQSTGLTPRWGYSTPSQAMEKGENLAEKLGCPVSSPSAAVECLREKPSEELRNLEYDADVVGDYTVNLYPWGPTTDGDFLEASPARLMSEGAFARKPVLMGTNANEGFWSLMYLDPLFQNKELSEDDMRLTPEEYMEKVDSIFQFYPENVRRLIAHEYRDRFSGPARFFFALDQMVADSDFVCNTESFAQALSDAGADVYRYYYAHKSSRDPWPKYTGVKHGDELEFTFGTPLNPDVSTGYRADEVGLARDIVTYWTNFVKTGSPNPSYVRSWPLYASPSWQYLSLTAEATAVAEGALRTNCSFWNEVIPTFLENPITEEEREDEDNANFGVCI